MSSHTTILTKPFDEPESQKTTANKCSRCQNHTPTMYWLDKGVKENRELVCEKCLDEGKDEILSYIFLGVEYQWNEKLKRFVTY